VSVGVVALDGSLLAGNASPGATRSYASIREDVERMLAEAADADAEEDERLGDARGDEFPAELCDARSRRERLRRCKEQLERAQAEEEASYRANLAWRADSEAKHGRRLAGRKPTPPNPAALAERRINTTDPDTRLMERAGGKSVRGYNAQVVASPEQVILAAQVTQSHNDADQLEPMVAQTVEALREAGIEEPVGIVLAAQSASTCANTSASACLWRARKRAIVAWSGIRFAVITRKATSSRQRRSIPRLERSPIA
jgi:hypothetical protein